MVTRFPSIIAATIIITSAVAACVPVSAQMRIETFWQCSRCKAEMGRGPAPPAQCPHCGALIANNPANEKVASMTGIVVALIVVVLLLVILAVTAVIVVKKGKIGVMKPKERRERDLPIVRGDDRDPKPPSYEL